MRLRDCHNFHDFRALARRRLPGPIFDYIDGAADDEATLRQNAASFERCDLVPNGMLQFALKPMWAINYLTHERFKLPQLDEHVDMGGGAMSIGRYFTEMLDPSMNWNDVGQMVRVWNGQFCLKGIMSVADARRAVEIGCTGIILSNHGGRQLDGSRPHPGGRIDRRIIS